MSKKNQKLYSDEKFLNEFENHIESAREEFKNAFCKTVISQHMGSTNSGGSSLLIVAN